MVLKGYGGDRAGDLWGQLEASSTRSGSARSSGGSTTANLASASLNGRHGRGQG